MKIRPLLLSATLLATSCAFAEEINGVNFSVVFQGSKLPSDSTPPWVQKTPIGNHGEASEENSIWRLNTEYEKKSSNVAASAQINAESGWKAELGGAGTTVECSVRIENQFQHAERCAAILYLGVKQEDGAIVPYVLNLAPDKVFFGTNPTNPSLSRVMDMVTEFHVFRITIDRDGIAELYIDNDPKPVITGYKGSGTTQADNYFLLVGSNSSADVGGVSEWKYIAFTNDGVFPPKK